jgi:phage gp46-like protein
MDIQGMFDCGDGVAPPPSLLEDDTLELGEAVLLMTAPYVERLSDPDAAAWRIAQAAGERGWWTK